jgi:hypothetical protein
VTAISEALARPPRPQHVPDDVLAEAAHRLGMKRSEIVSVTDVDAGQIVTTRDSRRVIIVSPDRPDGLGQSGVLALDDGRPLPNGAAVYCDPADARQQQSETAQWTVGDLDIEARRLKVPSMPTGGPGGPSRLPWVDGDPRRARACWLFLAERMSVTPAVAAQRSAEAAACRSVIVSSGWLGAGEVDTL